MKCGKLIVIEGACDGIGKSTQIEILKKHLLEDGEEVVSHHFPSYGVYQGIGEEKYLKGEYGSVKELSPYFINNLYAYDRSITWYEKLKKSYEKGDIILLDRYTTSSLIYQSALIEDIEERKQFIDYVIDFEYKKLGIKTPDQVIFLTSPFDLVTRLRNERTQNDGIEKDLHESDLEFMKKVYDNALFVSSYLNWNIIKCNNEDEMRSIEDIHEEIYKLIKKQ